jgi:hypothetical protein
MVGHHGSVGRYQATGLGWVRVRLPSLSNEFGPRGHEWGSKGFLSGALGELSAHPLCEGMGKGFPLAHALEGKRVNPEFTLHPTLSF